MFFACLVLNILSYINQHQLDLCSFYNITNRELGLNNIMLKN